MKRITLFFVTILMTLTFQNNVKAEQQPILNTTNYVVKTGDTMWIICNKFEIGISDIISLNPQINNPNNIYPGSILKIPNIDATKALENEVIRLVNVERAKVGLPALKANWQLSRVARYKAEDMRDKNYFSHTSPRYGTPFQMMRSFGISFTAAGENIAMGQRTPADVMKAWMNSSGHRQNILNSMYNQIGVGVAKSSDGRIYWVQQFIKG